MQVTYGTMLNGRQRSHTVTITVTVAQGSISRPHRPLGHEYLVNTMVGVTARLVSVAVKDHDLDDHVIEGE